jgi:DeoR/GlpR family transcriptional regulator of sugar metabolism
MTIRRDLEALDHAGVIDKVHGGATLPADALPTTVEPGFVVKSTSQVGEKEAIAAAAAALVRPGTAIGLTAGTTYHFKVTSTNTFGLTTVTSDSTFTTGEKAVMSNITITNITGSTATVTWTTNDCRSRLVESSISAG